MVSGCQLSSNMSGRSVESGAAGCQAVVKKLSSAAAVVVVAFSCGQGLGQRVPCLTYLESESDEKNVKLYSTKQDSHLEH